MTFTGVLSTDPRPPAGGPEKREETMQNPKHQNKKRAVTLTELLVVVVIISLLATIAVPVYVNKAEQARIATAIQETRELANAEEQCALVHGVYIPLQMLDDNPVDTSRFTSNQTDDIGYELANGTNISFIFATLPIVQQQGNQPMLSEWSSTSSRNYITMNNLYQKWAGPFVNINRAAFADKIRIEGSSNLVSFDFPLDPWGNPYRLYSPLGVVGTGALNEDFTNAYGSFSDGQITYNDPNRFDRFAVVSYGPDRHTKGQANATWNADRDDIYHLFGGIYTESSFQAFYR
jgi:prepilin-type N-terminal cleavage/methylation domain-containing protein